MYPHEIALPDAPVSLDAGGGRPAPFGTYRGPVRNVSTSAWDGNRGLMSRRRRERKGWIYFGAFSERYMVGLATVDAGLVANGFCYVYDRENDLLVEEGITLPLGFARDFEPRMDGTWDLSSGRRTWHIAYHDDVWRVQFSGRRLNVQLHMNGPGLGLSAIASSIGRPFAHTYKVAALPAHIDVSIDGKSGSADGGGSLDFTLGYPPRRTLWNWASMHGHTTAGQRVGLNLVGQFMNGQENGLWLDGELIALPQATFEYDASSPMAPWRIRTLDGTIDLEFQAEGKRSQNLKVGVMASVFTQPFGRFDGFIRLRGQEIKVTGLGVVEEHDATW